MPLSALPARWSVDASWSKVPPGTGKTHTASRSSLRCFAAGKKVGIASNSHKAVVNLLIACGDAARESGRLLHGIKVGGDAEGPLFSSNPGVKFVKDTRRCVYCLQGWSRWRNGLAFNPA